MICERIIDRAMDDDPDVDWVEIDWRQTVRRALRVVSRAGRKIDILLPRNQSLRHGDVVGQVGAERIGVFVKPCDILLLHPNSLDQMGILAAELGNQHAPIEIEDARLLTLDDGPARQLAEDLAIRFEAKRMRFHPRRSSVITPLGQKSV